MRSSQNQLKAKIQSLHNKYSIRLFAPFVGQLSSETLLKLNGKVVCCDLLISIAEQFFLSILDAAPILASTMHNDGWYPIHTAVLTGDLDIVKLIASQPGVDLGKLDTYNYSSKITEEEYRIRAEELSPKLKTVKAKDTSVLHYACMTGNMDVIKFLFDNGASPGAVDSRTATPIEYFDAERTDDMKAYSKLYEKWKIREESIQTVNTAVLERKIRKRDFEGFERYVHKYKVRG